MIVIYALPMSSFCGALFDVLASYSTVVEEKVRRAPCAGKWLCLKLSKWLAIVRELSDVDVPASGSV